MRDRLAELGVPVPRWRRSARSPSWRRSPAGRLAGGGQGGHAAGTTAAASGCSPAADEAAAAARDRHRAARRGAGAAAPRAGRGGRPLAVRAGRRPGRWCETVQRDGICVEVLAPAPGPRPARGRRGPAAGPPDRRRAGRGRRAGGRAVRDARTARCWSTSWRCGRTTPAHWTIEGARTSQFEQHLRAVLDYPLGATALTAPAVVMANVLAGPDRGGHGLDERVHHLFAALAAT